MLKKIFLGSVFVVVAILIINHISAPSRANNANIVDSIAEFKPVSNGAQQYQPEETKIEIIPDVKIKPKSLAVLKSATKAVNVKTNTARKTVTTASVHTISPRSSSKSSVKTIVKRAPIARKAPVVKTVVKTPVKTRVSYHYTSKYGTTMRWDATSLRFLSNIAAFDYSYSIRAKIIRKIETYARAHHVSVVTMSMMNAMTY